MCGFLCFTNDAGKSISLFIGLYEYQKFSWNSSMLMIISQQFIFSSNGLLGLHLLILLTVVNTNDLHAQLEWNIRAREMKHVFKKPGRKESRFCIFGVNKILWLGFKVYKSWSMSCVSKGEVCKYSCCLFDAMMGKYGDVYE